MKLLWGPVPAYAGVDEPHQVVHFGHQGLSYKDGDSWKDLFHRLPSGFDPDVVM